MPVFLQTPTQVSLTGLSNNTFGAVTSGAPTTASGVILLFENTSGRNVIVTLRQTGSTDTQLFTVGCGANTQAVYHTGVSNQSGNMQFDANLSVASFGVCYLMGYYLASEATFFTNAVQITSPTLSNAYQTFNVSANVPAGSPGIFLDVNMTGSGGGPLFLRQNTSSDTLAATITSAPISSIVGVDSSQQFQAKTSTNGSGQSMYLRGYLTSASGLVWHQNMISVGGSWTTGSFQNVPAGTSAFSVGGIYTCIGTGNNLSSMVPTGCNTSSFNLQQTIVNQYVVGTNQVAQINPTSATQPVFEQGIFTQAQWIYSRRNTLYFI